MAFKQTDTHRYGKGSYHQIGLVRGQFGNVPMDKWLKFVQEAGFDGWEEASWELDLDKCGTDAGAEAYAKERVDLAKKHGLEIFTVAAHLQGQALGDEPSAKTLQFIGGEAVQAYKAWRDKGNKPPRTDPYFVPDEVGKMIHAQASRALVNCVRLAHYLGKLQNRKVALPGFVGSPAHCWSHFFLFPPLPASIAGHAIPDVRQVSLELLVERFKPGLGRLQEVRRHLRPRMPSERAGHGRHRIGERLHQLHGQGRLRRRRRLQPRRLAHGMARRLGGAVHPRVRRPHPLRHIKGVQVIREHTRAGLLGGHRPMGHPLNGWNFVTAGTARDANSVEEIMIELNRVGYDGAVSIEWEDNDAEQHAGAKAALANVRRGDLPPSGMRHDEMLKA